MSDKPPSAPGTERSPEAKLESESTRAANKPTYEIARSKPAIGLKFSDTTFVGLDLEAAISILTKPKPSFFGHRETLFAGFCAWLVTPTVEEAVKDAMIAEMSEQLATAEGADIENFGYPPQTFANKNYRRFMAELYYPTGGMRAVIGALKRVPKPVEVRRGSEKEIRFLVGMAGVLHYHTHQRDNNRASHERVALWRAAKIVPKLNTFVGPVADEQLTEGSAGKPKLKPLSTGTLWNYLDRHEPSLHFLYAASGIPRDGNRTLLDDILERNTAILSETEAINDWFSAAQYVADKIFAGLQVKTSNTLRLLPAVKFANARRFEPPHYEKQDLQKIDEHIKKKRK